MSSGDTPFQPPSRPIPSFDPAPSARFALDVLERTGSTGAVIGRLAVWAWVTDPGEQEFTKDFDVAVSRADLRRIRDWALAEGLRPRELPIGGLNFRAEAPPTRVDFIERSQNGDLSPLFEEAIEAAVKSGVTATVGDLRFPLAPREHLAAMKLGSGRPEKDDRDVKRLLRDPGIDVTLLRRLTKQHLGPAAMNRLETLLREVGSPLARRDYDADES